MKMGKTLALLLVAVAAFPLPAADHGRLGLGYDEGLSVRFFLDERMAIQAGLGFEYLGGYSQTANNGGALESEMNVGLNGGFLFNFFSSEYMNLGGLAQLALVHDGARSAQDIGDRNWIFLRAAMAPEFIVAQHLGLGLRFGLEVAHKGESKRQQGGVIVDTDDAVTNVRFFGPQNPFGGSTLGMALYVYLK